MFENWLPYFAKGTNYTVPNTTLRAANASVPTPANLSSLYSGGPVHISFSNYALPFTSWANEAFESLGLTTFPDSATVNFWVLSTLLLLTT